MLASIKGNYGQSMNKKRTFIVLEMSLVLQRSRNSCRTFIFLYVVTQIPEIWEFWAGFWVDICCSELPERRKWPERKWEKSPEMGEITHTLCALTVSLWRRKLHKYFTYFSQKKRETLCWDGNRPKCLKRVMKGGIGSEKAQLLPRNIPSICAKIKEFFPFFLNNNNTRQYFL